MDNPAQDKAEKPAAALPAGAQPAGFLDNLILSLFRINRKATWQARKDDPKEKAALDALAHCAGQHGFTPPKLVIYASDEPNAMSMLSGTVAISTNALDILKPKQLEAVLGHEMSHHRRRPRDLALLLGTLYGARFGYRKLAQPSVKEFFAAREIPNLGSLAESAGLLAADVEIIKAYQRGCEYEADHAGAQDSGSARHMKEALQAIEKRGEELGDVAFDKSQKAFDKKPEWEKPILRMLDELEPRWVRRIRLNPRSLLDGHPRMSHRIGDLEVMEKSEETLSSNAVSR